MSIEIREATDVDLPRINAIYNRYIVGSHVSFDVEPWTDDARREWFTRYGTGRYRVLVAESDGLVVGSAHSSPWRPKRAYDTSVETTVVLDEQWTGRGIGEMLLGRLLEILDTEDVHRAYAIVALPNEASIAVHEKLGYRLIGVLDEVGRKDGRYWSTALLERRF